MTLIKIQRINQTLIRKRLLRSVLFIIWTLVHVNSFSQEWPNWRGPNRNGISIDRTWNYKSLSSVPKVLWENHVGKGYSSVTVAQNCLYTMGYSDSLNTVVCIDIHSGEIIWKFEFECIDRYHYGALSTPVYHKNRVYVIGRNGKVFCLSALSGALVWKVNLSEKYDLLRPKYGYSGSPVIEDNLVIFNVGKNGFALDINTGNKIWGIPGKAGYATPVIYKYKGVKYAMIFSHRKLNAVELATGTVAWSFPWEFNDGADSADPIVVGNKVFISTAYRNGATMIDFSGNKPKQKWFTKDIQDEFGSSIYKDGYLFVPHGDTRHETAYLKCIEFNTGNEVWTRDTGHCSIIYVDSKFVVLNQWGEVTIMNADESGQTDLAQATVVETSRRDRCWTAPVIAQGKLFVRTSKGKLVCIDVSK